MHKMDKTLEKKMSCCKITNDFEKKVREELLDSGDYSDVTFLVGADARPFKAHRFILMTSSIKFKRMMELHKGEKPILIPEIDPDVFDLLLKAIYLHRFEIDSIKTAVVCSKIFGDFGLPSAVKQCEEYLNHPSNISVDNAIVLYELNLRSKERSEIIEECLKLFAINTREILKSVAFSRAHINTIVTIFDLPKLNIVSEIELLDALRDFAEMHGALPGHNADGNEDRFKELVKPAVEKVRLLSLTPKEIVKSESIRILYTTEQILSVLANLIAPENPLYKIPEDISTNKFNRSLLSDETLSQFQDIDETPNETNLENLANTAQIDSQICETPKTSFGQLPSSVDWTPSKLPILKMQDSIEGTELPEGMVETKPIGSSTVDSFAIDTGDDTLPDTLTDVKRESPLKKGKIVLPKYRCRNYLGRKSKTVAEENLEKTSNRKRRKAHGDKCLPLKKRGRLSCTKDIDVSEFEESPVRIEPHFKVEVPELPETQNDKEFEQMREMPVLEKEEQGSNMTDEELVTYLATYRLQSAVLWAGFAVKK